MALDCIIRDTPLDPGWQFEEMRGLLVKRAEQLEVLQRLGLNDQEWRKTGVRAAPSKLVTVSYYTSRSTARAFYQTAVEAIGETKNVVKFGENMGYYVIENALQQGDIQARGNVIGSLVDSPTVVMAMTWTLKHVPDP